MEGLLLDEAAPCLRNPERRAEEGIPDPHLLWKGLHFLPPQPGWRKLFPKLWVTGKCSAGR